MLAPLLEHLQARRELTAAQVQTAVEALTDPALPAEAKAGFLLALADKGESPGEIAEFARALRGLSTPLRLDSAVRQADILDVCGTGGDRLGTFNISTTVAFVCAAAGVQVAKHGNRAVTSQSGSADVLGALGVPIEIPPEEAAERLRRDQFVFLFAPYYHPAFQAIGPARRLCAKQERRTIFNFLGPLLNPARPTLQLVGVSDPSLVEPLAGALRGLGVRRGMVAAGGTPGGGWLDELSVLGVNEIAEFYQERGFIRTAWRPDMLPLQPASLADLAGGGPTENARRIEAILEGRDRSPARDAVLLNAGAALMVAGRARTIADGWVLAETVIDDGRAAAKLAAIRRRA